jgi:hypothetical protein
LVDADFPGEQAEMKLLLIDYIGSLKERGELDAILPDLLSELGFHVISRPAIGVAQRGVDIAATGKDDDGVRKLFLFSVKAGDLTRAEWNTGVQALRPSLDEILDDYIPNRVPPQYKKMKVIICLVVGGIVQQAVQPLVTAYTKKYSSKKVSFQEWNGDRIAELLLAGPLREKLLPKPLRSSFQKAVAMVDQPDVSYEHFAKLVTALCAQVSTDKDRTRVTRQIYICMWVLFIWGREIDNLDAPYRASELALLHIWELVKPFIGKRGTHAAAVASVLHHLVILHVTIAALFLERKILPYVARQHALSLAVNSSEPTDVNLKMFDTLGRLALTGHWMIWLGQYGGRDLNDAQITELRKHVTSGLQMIANNPSLYLPLMDEQAIELALFLGLAAQLGHADGDIRNWLAEMVRRLNMTVTSHGRYPTVLRDYTDLIGHPKTNTNEYREEVTPGSILIPLLLAWVTALNDHGSIAALVDLKAGPLTHCTLQLWLPDEGSERHLYLNNAVHGAALADLPVTNGGQDLLKVLAEASKNADGFESLSAVKSGYFPLVLTACRHYRLPVPYPFWISLLVPPEAVSAVVRR